jgi:DNA-binding CsgD family transcriptional regulator
MDRDESRTSEGLLEALGVPPDAQPIWRILLASPNTELSELGRLVGLPAAGVRAAIGALVSARLVRESTAPAGVTAIDPTLVIETHIARAERELAERAEEFAALRSFIPDFANEYARGRNIDGSQPGVEVIEALQDIRRQLDLASETATTDARTLAHTSTVDGFRESLASGLGMIARGVRCRSIVGPHELNNPELYSELQAWHEHGEHFRVLPEVPTRLMIVDRSVALLMVDPADYRSGAVFVRVQSLVDMLILLFDHLWSIAVPIFESSGDPEAPTGRQARTLELLAIGNTDELIARTLGVGPRTIGRDISDLKTILGVSSRAEIAAAAVRKRWV